MYTSLIILVHLYDDPPPPHIPPANHWVYLLVNSVLYLVTDYVPHTLQSVVEREEFTPADLLWFMRQVIRATAFMHSRGVAHRDLKASRCVPNIFF